MNTLIDPLVQSPGHHGRPTRRRRPSRWLAPIAVLVAAMLVALWVLTSYGGDDAAPPSTTSASSTTAPGASASSVASLAEPGPTTTTAGSPDTTLAPAEAGDTEAEPTDDEEDAAADAEGDDAQPADDAEPAVEPQPEPEPEPGVDVPLVPTACDAVLAAGKALAVAPDPLALDPGDYTGHVTITNCTGADVDWSAATIDKVALDTAASSLPAGASTLLGFTIDADAYEPGAITFKIKVSEPGHNHYVDVSAFRTTLGKDLVPTDIGLTGGEDAGGCANQCITQALIHTSYFSPNVSLAIKTNVQARMKVWVSTHAPQEHADGYPYFPGVSPIDQHLGIPTTEWTAELAPLQPGTKYFVIVKATDRRGHSSYRSGVFTTITPFENPDGLVDAGEPSCVPQCITQALVHVAAHSASPSLTVESNVPAAFAVWVSTEAPAVHDGVPSFGGLEPVAVSGDELTQSWAVQLGQLEYSATYHIVVRATDAKGYRAYQAGTFETGEQLYDVLIEIEKIVVLYDGDPGWNRGELAFAWSADGVSIGSIGQQKVQDNTELHFEKSHSSVVVHGLSADTFLPTIDVSASEYDADGLVEWCPEGNGVHDQGYDAACDRKTNLAGTGLMYVSSIEDMAECIDVVGYEVGPHTRCIQLKTEDHGDDYARFVVVVTYTVLD